MAIVFGSAMNKRQLPAASFERVYGRDVRGFCPGAESHTNGRFWRERSFMMVDGNDRVWSAADAG